MLLSGSLLAMELNPTEYCNDTNPARATIQFDQCPGFKVHRAELTQRAKATVGDLIAIEESVSCRLNALRQSHQDSYQSFAELKESINKLTRKVTALDKRELAEAAATSTKLRIHTQRIDQCFLQLCETKKNVVKFQTQLISANEEHNLAIAKCQENSIVEARKCVELAERRMKTELKTIQNGCDAELQRTKENLRLLVEKSNDSLIAQTRSVVQKLENHLSEEIVKREESSRMLTKANATLTKRVSNLSISFEALDSEMQERLNEHCSAINSLQEDYSELLSRKDNYSKVIRTFEQKLYDLNARVEQVSKETKRTPPEIKLELKEIITNISIQTTEICNHYNMVVVNTLGNKGDPSAYEAVNKRLNELKSCIDGNYSEVNVRINGLVVELRGLIETSNSSMRRFVEERANSLRVEITAQIDCLAKKIEHEQPASIGGMKEYFQVIANKFFAITSRQADQICYLFGLVADNNTIFKKFVPKDFEKADTLSCQNNKDLKFVDKLDGVEDNKVVFPDFGAPQQKCQDGSAGSKPAQVNSGGQQDVKKR